MTSQRTAAVELDLTISDRIHNAIHEFFSKQRYRVVEYKEGRRRTSQHEAVKAQTILVRSQQVGWVEARNRRCGGRGQEKTAWTWVALVHFDQQVDTDEVEAELERGPLRILRDNELDQQVDISFLDAVYEHPPETQSSHGTRVTYRFTADLSPL